MTELENDESFAEFSEVLDDEEFPQTEDGELMLRLRETLSDDSELPPLPEDFTERTVSKVLHKHSETQSWKRLILSSSPFLTRTVFSLRSLGSIAALISLLFGVGYVSLKLLGTFGVLLILCSVSWMIGRWSVDRGLPGLPTQPFTTEVKSFSFVHGFCFFVLPAIALLGSAGGTARMIDVLGIVSYTFREDKELLSNLGLLCGFGTLILLTLALLPTLKSYRMKFGRKSLALLLHHSFYAAWVGLLLWLRTYLEEPTSGQPLLFVQELSEGEGEAWTVMLVLATLVLTLLCTLIPYQPKQEPQFKQSVKKSLMSLVIGGTPIAACLILFYQLHLTRELHFPKDYENTISYVDTWVNEQMAIPDRENGWLEVKHFMVKDDEDAGLSEGINDRLSVLSQYWDVGFFSGEPRDPQNHKLLVETFAENKETFLAELPRLEKALEKPHFSSLVTEAQDGYSFDMLVPNFILFRAVSQGMAVMAQDAYANGDTKETARYLSFGLKWSHRPQESSWTLIGLMIRVAQMAIALEPMERMILEGDFSSEQLEQLQRALTEAQLPKNALLISMKHEIYLVDKFLLELPDRDDSLATDYGLDVPAFFDLMPRSYLESERKAYLNFELGRASYWTNLGMPNTFDIDEEISPFNLASQALVPSTYRAQAQLMLARSKIDAHRLVCALERYKRDNGLYPDILDQLTPTYIEALPKDTISGLPWDRKPTFQYQLNADDDTYLLISESPAYELLDLDKRQVYGYDGSFGEKRMKGR